MADKVVKQFRHDLLEWSQEYTRDFPWRTDDTPLYDVFIAEFFLTQTPAENVAAVYPEFLSQFPDLDAIATASMGELEQVIEPLGFQNMRAAAMKEIASEYGELPSTVNELLKLERVGPYVANATICFTFESPKPIMDRNVDRIYRRLLGDDWPDTDSSQWEMAAEIVPEDTPKQYNLGLLDFGASICTPDPNCEECFASEYCSFYQRQSRRDG